jgi:hypothetical protein
VGRRTCLCGASAVNKADETIVAVRPVIDTPSLRHPPVPGEMTGVNPAITTITIQEPASICGGGAPANSIADVGEEPWRQHAIAKTAGLHAPRRGRGSGPGHRKSLVSVTTIHERGSSRPRWAFRAGGISMACVVSVGGVCVIGTTVTTSRPSMIWRAATIAQGRFFAPSSVHRPYSLAHRHGRKADVIATWYTQTPKESGYTARRVGGRRRAKSIRYPDSAGGWVYQPHPVDPLDIETRRSTRDEAAKIGRFSVMRTAAPLFSPR